jgi:DNA invertase Pin-like site-specific DNA recombinase
MARKSRKHTETATVQTVKTVYETAAYIRLSAVDKKNKGDSLETQRAIIESYIAEHSDMELREIYIDNGLSGQSFERPAFQQMLGDMESGKINCCAVKDLSRLGRNAIDTGFYVEKFFPTTST